MADLKKIGNISGKVLIIASISYFINYISNGLIFTFFSLSPSSILNHYEAWRLFTYPLAGTNLESYLLFFVTFATISPKLEKSFKKPYYLFFVLLICCLQGTLSVIYFNNTGLVLFGTEGITFFVLTLFTLLNYDKKLLIHRFKPVQAPIISVILTSFWLISVISHSFLFNDSSILNTSLFSSGFGLLAGLLIFAEMKILEKVRSKKIKPEEPQIEIPKPEELAMAYSTNRVESKKINQMFRENWPKLYEDEDFTEDHLNSILDKINESGKDSLTYEEIDYLKQYSKRI